jgi:hypothetical protein
MDEIKNLQMRVAKLERFQEIVTGLGIAAAVLLVVAFFRH